MATGTIPVFVSDQKLTGFGIPPDPSPPAPGYDCKKLATWKRKMSLFPRRGPQSCISQAFCATCRRHGAAGWATTDPPRQPLPGQGPGALRRGRKVGEETGKGRIRRRRKKTFGVSKIFHVPPMLLLVFPKFPCSCQPPSSDLEPLQQQRCSSSFPRNLPGH